MAKAQACYQGPADHHWEPMPNFQVGQQVFVRAENIWTTRPSKKLSEKYLGPYKIIAQSGTHFFTLQLPEHLHAIHPVFHVSKLEPLVLNTILNCTQPPPPPVESNDDLKYEIAKILDPKLDNQCRWKLLYYVYWSSYEGSNEENSWLLATKLDHAQELVADFHTHYPNKPGPLTQLLWKLNTTNPLWAW